jgi:cyclopropane-fatty-acyl-phospholipid synthase
MLISLAERGRIPDSWIRAGIRYLLRRRLRQEEADDPRRRERIKEERIRTYAGSDIAVAQDAANEQHYEVPVGFYQEVLGPRLKYSSAYWPAGVHSLAEAEEAMLRLTCERAELADGQKVLELGCGWGSLTLWMAREYPQSEILAVSNSATQREHIEARAAEDGLTNVRVITEDVTRFEPEQRFHRVVSVEMMEHMRNHGRLMERIHEWLLPGGKLFVHIFCHREAFYPFEDEGSGSWMARTFFTGGVMPSFDLLERCQSALELENHWRVNGQHYARTLEAWLRRGDSHRAAVVAALRSAHGDDAELWWQRWRIFFMACSELFAFRGGEEWFVGHYRFVRPAGEET